MKTTMKVLLAILAMLPTLTLAQNNTTNDDQFESVFNLSERAIDAKPSFGFKETDSIEVKTTTETEITLTIPVVLKKDAPITEYDIMLSTGNKYTDLEDQGYAQKIECEGLTAIGLKDQETFECTIATKEIEKDTTYYLTVIPKKDGKIGMNSKEGMTINHKELLAATKESNESDMTYRPAANTADEGKMCTNISHTQNNDKITITWKALVQEGNLIVEGRAAKDLDFKKIGKTAIKNETFTFTASQHGTHTIKLSPEDKKSTKIGCTYNLKIEKFEITTITTKTGPQETLMIIGLVAVIGGYFILRKRH